MKSTTLGEYNPFARKTVSYLRARIVYMENLIRNHRAKESMDYNLLRHGFIPYEREVNDQIQKLEKEFGLEDKPASFLELTRFGNWFVLHPEKVCGFEVISSQRIQPLNIRGDKNFVIKRIKEGILADRKNRKSNAKPQQVKDMSMGSYHDHLKLAKAKAEAILRLSSYE